MALPSLTAKAPVPNRGPFYLALFDLSRQPMLRYSGSAPETDASWNMVVASGGQEFGTLTVGGSRIGVMRVDGKTYVKPPASMLEDLPGDLPASKIRGRWITGDDSLTAQLPPGLRTPRQLAGGFLAGLKDSSDFPDIGASPARYHGTPALAATMRTGTRRAGTLYVSASAPYRVLGVHAAAGSSAPPSSGGGASTAQATAFVTRAEVADSAQPSFAPLTAAQVDQEYGQLIDQTKTLGSAIDVGIRFDFNQAGNLNCSDSSCTVTENVTTSTTSTQDARLSGDVTADMTANVTVNGQPGGGCTQQSSLPINGSGTMSCTDAGVAGPVTEIKNQAQQQADAEAAASPGQRVTVPYTLSFRASVEIEALAEVAATVTREVNTERSQRSDADTEEQNAQACLTSYTGVRRTCSKLFSNNRFKDHVLQGHVRGGSQVTSGKTLFQDYWSERQIKDLITKTVRYGTESPNPNARVGGTVYTMHFGFPVGYVQNTAQTPLYAVRVVMYPDGTLNTALPVRG